MLTSRGCVNTGKGTALCLPLGGVSTSPVAGCSLLAFFNAYLIPMQMNTEQTKNTVGMIATATIQVWSASDICSYGNQTGIGRKGNFTSVIQHCSAGDQ